MGVANITATCQQSRTVTTVPVTMETNSLLLNNLLPDCHYQFVVGVASCQLDTPPGPGKCILYTVGVVCIMYDDCTCTVDVGESIHRYDNGSIRLEWHIPLALRDQSDVTVEIKIDGQWIPVHLHGNTPHIQTHLDGDQRAEFRFRLAEWTGFAEVDIPSVVDPSQTSLTTSESTTSTIEHHFGGIPLSEVGVVYGVIFSLLVVAITSTVIIILVLKYVQMTRRDTDKGNVRHN